MDTGRDQGKAKPLRISRLKNRKRGRRLLSMNTSGVIYRSTNWRKETAKIGDPSKQRLIARGDDPPVAKQTIKSL
jgi:hypothetical protein